MGSGNQRRIGVLGSALWCALWAVAASGQATPNAACMDCHSDRELVRDEGQPAGSSVFVDQGRLDASVHGGWNCVDCHATASDDHPPDLPPASCADCHGDAAEAFGGSLHGVALQGGDKDAPSCADCHGSHDILPSADAQSRVHPQQIPHTCAHCHASTEFIERRPLAMGQPLEGYQQSVHYKALQAGKHGATCTDCHEGHALQAPGDPRSAIHPSKVPGTCGKCHGAIRDAFRESVHGRALARNNLDAPSCADCHGEHEIRAPEDPLSRVFPAALASQSCGQCHANVALAQRYGLDPDRVATYRQTYHGLAVQEGSVVTANCASCHGVHNILPSTDRQSTIHPDNLQYTCGTCHEGATRQFAAIPVHAGAGTEGNGSRWASLLRQFYIWLIVVTLGGMLLHNGAIWVHAVVRRFRRTRAGVTYVRLNRFQLLQHAVLVV
ncbi:MAG: hypothetical protein AB1505_01275, partial [Candidatus Latescibacterota bacterium]